MKVLVVGGGGREHALCWTLAASPLCHKLYCAPGNAGIAEDAECVAIAMDDADENAACYAETTREIQISVRPHYLNEQSSPDEGQYLFAYQVQIKNLGDNTVQLRNRYWRITDAHGRTQEVRGPGVVGEQPILRPGDAFEYTSGTPLATETGFMVGSYEMVTEDGEHFDAAIPAFSLDSPFATKRLN